MYQYTNQLINETSPYLLQHAHNPVHWLGWNKDSLQKAIAEDKLIIVSIGYSACHWCHVMEHESFEDVEVAEIMNAHFISIKVDREERPDVDQVYMDAVQLISGRGGWPLNAICLPDGRPVYAGTYFPKENWKQVLQYFIHELNTNKEKLYERAADITRGIKSLDELDAPKGKVITKEELDKAFQSLYQSIDMIEGGRTGAPKFPMPVNYNFLLEYFHKTQNELALNATKITLDKMLMGGIYDQLGGGFARYSVDAFWEIPHFEKMLYDNAQLVSLYSKAFQITKDESYKRVVYETLDFIRVEMTGLDGNFFSALDADSEGEEGKFYVWNYNELEKLLGNAFPEFKSVYNISEQGNFEGNNHLTLKFKLGEADIHLKQWKTMLLQERSKRIRPGLDDKSLTSWNAMMLRGYVDAFCAFGEQHFLVAAKKNAEFILRHQLNQDFSIWRNYKNGKSNISGFLDDYAFTIDSFLALYENTFNEQWLVFAQNITHYTIDHFYDNERNIFFYTNKNDSPLIARKTETSDNVIPASNSVMAKVLIKLGLMTDNQHLIHLAGLITANMKENAIRHTSFYANWASVMLSLEEEPNTVAIVGKDALEVRRSFSKYYLPNCIFIGTNQASTLPLLKEKVDREKTTIYICKNNTCGMPVYSVEDALKQIQNN